MNTTTLLVQKSALSSTHLHTSPAAALHAGQVRLQVDAFALTSNNITYAAFGEAMSYWGFYPSAVEGQGIVPVWGFGTVLESQCDGVAVGQRFYGYWPMGTHAVLSPARVNTRGFVDGAAHRAELHSVYNQYVNTASDPFYTAGTEATEALLRPLFMTSFLIDDFLADNAFFGASTVILSSASSKTAYGTAYCLAKRAGLHVIGLTSERNRAFCESLGCYSRVMSYEQLGDIAADTACVYIDFAGNAALRRAVHTRFTQLAYSCAVGGTHVSDLGGAKALPGPRATLFFAPAQIKKRNEELGAAAFGASILAAWQSFTAHSAQENWLVVQTHKGADAVQAAYAQVLAGEGDARVGHVLSF